MLNNNFDSEERFIIIDIKRDNKIVTLLNIYASNNENPTFFKKVLTDSHLLSLDCEEIILEGDFNLVMDVQKDKKGGNPVMHKKFTKKGRSKALA